MLQGFNRTVTKSQFSRIMQALKINILMSDVEKICRKFEDEAGCGEINYPEFCQYVDNSFLHSTVEKTENEKREIKVEAEAADASSSGKGSSWLRVAEIRRLNLESFRN